VDIKAVLLRVLMLRNILTDILFVSIHPQLSTWPTIAYTAVHTLLLLMEELKIATVLARIYKKSATFKRAQRRAVGSAMHYSFSSTNWETRTNRFI
jgi:hypothetical protein